MADDGFSLNISASSGARKPVKKKNTFRAKKNAKRAKTKAVKNAVGHTNGQHPQHKAHSSASKPRETNQRNDKLTLKSNNASTTMGDKRKSASAAIATGSLTKRNDNTDNEEEPIGMTTPDEIDDEDEVIAEEQAEMDDRDEGSDSEDVEDASIADANSAVDREMVDVKETGTEISSTTATKAFGTRRNPNKDAYKPENYTQVRTEITNVLEKPLESSESEKIFAAQTFESMELHPRLVQSLQKDTSSGGFGFGRPTNVQVKTIPMVLAGNDVLVKGETGSGKTLAYLLPIVQKLQAREPRVKREDGCIALILAPTRELCLQILDTANKLIQSFVFLVPGAIIGGEKKKAEKARLRKGICILIATPGRLADHLVNTQSFNYSSLQFLVLDEADRLLDMGFEKQVTQILSIIDSKQQSKRQNILVSATINKGVQELAKMSLSNPVLIDADDGSESKVNQSAVQTTTSSSELAQETFSTPHQLMQHFMIVPAKARLCTLTCFLRQELTNKDKSKCKIVVFLSTCDSVDFHYALFRKCAWPSEGKGKKSSDAAIVSSLFGSQGAVFRLHGNIAQQERMTTFKNFCSATSGVLLCTDVAARGLNLSTVQWIVQYDPPTETRDYVHRVGRTARSGKQGSSLLFLMPSESEYLDYLKKQNLTLNALSLEKTITRVAKHGGFASSRKKLLHEVIQGDLQYLYEQTLLADKELFELACQAFHSFVRSYATHSSDTRKIFHVRSLHFGHVAKSFALREPPASNKLRDTGRNAKKGTLQKRKDREEKEKSIQAKKVKFERQEKRRYAQQVSEFAD